MGEDFPSRKFRYKIAALIASLMVLPLIDLAWPLLGRMGLLSDGRTGYTLIVLIGGFTTLFGAVMLWLFPRAGADRTLETGVVTAAGLGLTVGLLAMFWLTDRDRAQGIELPEGAYVLIPLATAVGAPIVVVGFLWWLRQR